MTREILIVLLALYAITVSNGTIVSDCNSGDDYDDPNAVTITACDGPPCILKQGTDIKVVIAFEAPRDIKSLTTVVNADVLGLQLPFIGVSGSNACNLIYKPDGTKANCPLIKGEKYVYKNSFPVRPFYPRIDTTVHWALSEGKNDITCFEVPAKIVA